MMKCMRLPRAVTGFSFVELLVSAAILGVLASVAMPLAEMTVRRKKEHDLRVALRDIRLAIDGYKLASLNGRIAALPDQSGYPPSLIELVGGVEDVEHPGVKLYYLRRVPRDPFFPDQTVNAIDTWGKRSFDSPPDNPREGVDLFDVYSLSTQTGLNGVPYKEW